MSPLAWAGVGLLALFGLLMTLTTVFVLWLLWRTHRAEQRARTPHPTAHTHTDIEEGRDPEWT